MNLKYVLALAVSVSATPAFAQEQGAEPAQPVAAAILTTPTSNILRTGTKVPVKTAEALTTKGKKLKVGQRIQLETAEAIKLGDNVVIPSGSPVIGEITDVRNKGMWGKSGHITAQVRYVLINGRQIRLTGTFDDKGVTGTAGVVAAVALIPVAGFFTTGTSAQIPLGSPVNAFLDEDVTVAFAQPTQAITVPIADEVTPTPIAAVAQN